MHDDQLPPARLHHLHRLTDGTGLIQHATFNVPNLEEGYATDDNARALLLMTLISEGSSQVSADVGELAQRYMAFVGHAFNARERRFRNFLDFDRQWLEERGSEDCHGRTLHALGAVSARWPDPANREWARRLFLVALGTVLDLGSPRGVAFTLLGLDAYLARHPDDGAAGRIHSTLAQRLLDQYTAVRGPDWLWYENILTYSNAKLPHAMIASGRLLDRADMIEAGLESLDWLAAVQRPEGGHFVPIGSNGFYPRGDRRARFAQQPIEAQATVSAALQAHAHTGESRWIEEANRALAWFVGDNDLGLPVCEPDSGACRDGLEANGINQNRGAESTLAFLLARVELGGRVGADRPIRPDAPRRI